ncbi:MAG: L,D-transpeptidase family protein [Brumimicrobium sp.]
MRKFYFCIHFFLLSLLFLGLFGCSSFSSNNSEQTFESSDEQKLSFILSNNKINNINLDDESINFCNAFYAKRNYKTIWVKNDAIMRSDHDFLDYLNNDVSLNLPEGFTRTPDFTRDNNLYEREIIAVLKLAEYLDIQENGFIDFKDASFKTHKFIDFNKLDRFIKGKNRSVSWELYAMNYSHKDSRIPKLHNSLNKFTSNYPLDDKASELSLPHDTVGHSNNKVATTLKERGFISDITISSDSLREVLKEYQYFNGLNPDGVTGKNTIKILNETNLDRYHKGIIALEKLKSIPDSLIASKFIEVNIPSFKLRFFNADTLVSEHKVVVGANATQTPEFSALIKFIVTHPYWHVPYSIASTEILHGARNDSTFFEKRSYTLLDSGKVISPNEINWNDIKASNFPYSVRQGGGRTNSLGLIKILFPNTEAVYIHDTPSKHLFERDIRNFSHGCIRTENPLELSRNILAIENHVYMDSIDTLVQKDRETYLKINAPFLVHINYRTAESDDSTKQVRFYQDIYSREKKLLQLFDEPTP